jgi:hypothetical protein
MMIKNLRPNMNSNNYPGKIVKKWVRNHLNDK